MTLPGSACEACGRVSVPAEERCLVCRAATLARGIEARGAVLAATRTSAGEPVALVELPGGARVLTLGELDAAPGERVRVVVAERGYRFAR